MRFLLIVSVAACLALALNAQEIVQEDITISEGETGPWMIEGEVTETIVVDKPTTTRKPSIRAQNAPTTTLSPESVAVVDAVEVAPVSPNKNRKTPANRTRMSGTRRKQPAAKAKVDAVPVEEEESPKAEMTSPASVDTASVSILAPKNFKPTPKPLDEIQQAQGLMEFLKKRKIERIQATITEDPFVAILATATAPTAEDPVTTAVESSGIRSGAGSTRRLPSTGRRFGASNNRITTTTTTTTEVPTTEAPTTAAAISSRRLSPNRFSALRNRAAATTVTTESTTTAQPAAEEPKQTVDTSARSKLFPKRPANLRPIGNSILRRKDQASSTVAPTPAAVATEEEAIGVPEEIELVEPSTAAPLRKARGRLTARTSGI